MELKNFTYLFLLIISLAVPLVLSFDKRKQFDKKIRYILPAILITAVFFLIWDINFTRSGIWSFNMEYTLGINLWSLPVEEWLFFPVVLYGCIFIYEIVKINLEKQDYTKLFVAISVAIIVGFGLISFYFKDKAYTFMAFLLPAVFMGYTIFRNLLQPNITHVYITYFFSLLPLLFIYGILAALPLVEYHPDHILGIRIVHIPVEDFAFFFLMILMVTTIYEFLKLRKFY